MQDIKTNDIHAWLAKLQNAVGKANFKKWKKGTRGHWLFVSASASEHKGLWTIKLEFAFRETYWRHYRQVDFNDLFPKTLVLEGDNGNVVE